MIKAREKVQAKLRDIEYEQETGMPAITQWMMPADQMYTPKGGE